MIPHIFVTCHESIMASYSFETLLVTVNKKVALIVLNRSNAFNGAQYLEFADALKQCDRDPNVNVIAVTGNGRYFRCVDRPSHNQYSSDTPPQFR